MADNDEKPPQTAMEYFLRGDKRRHEGDLDGAIADYSEAIRLEPDFIPALGNRGIAWSGKGEYDKAIADYTKILDINPDDAQTWNNRGRAWDDKGEYDQAIADLNEAIRLKPDYETAWNNRGVSWGKKGEHDQAIADFDEALRLKPNDEKSWHNRGNAWLRKGEYDKAVNDYDEALRLKPDLLEAIQNRGAALALKAGEQIKADTREFRGLYDKNLKRSMIARAFAIIVLLLIGAGIIGTFVLIFCIETGVIKGNDVCRLLFPFDSYFSICEEPAAVESSVPNKPNSHDWRLLPWLPVVTAIFSPFLILWWMLQRWGYELKTLAYGFHRKAIVEERILFYFHNDPEKLKKMQELYIVHWMEKSPLEVMLTIAGKSKGMGGGDSPTSTLLGKVAKTANDVIKEAGKDGAP